ncbi:MAG TPA: selenoneine synthase SenA [Candidatus Binatia bacterium]
MLISSDLTRLKEAAQMTAVMREFRGRTLDLVADLDDSQLIGPQLPTVNPPLWEIGHIAWFQEFWTLRHLRNQKELLANSDQIYNSTDVAHDARWELCLPSREKTLQYMASVLERVLDGVRARELTAEEFYFHLLATYHESMHAEALAYTRQTLGYPAPQFSNERSPLAGGIPIGRCSGDAEVPGGKYVIGAQRDFPFAFDNEKWAHPIEIKPFRIARTAVANGEFLSFIEDGGYRREHLWSDAGWNWLHSRGHTDLQKSFEKFFNKNLNHGSLEPQVKLEHPAYWQKEANGRWRQHVFDRYLPLNENHPVVHVSWYEAEAFCRWAGRRLPTEPEWEVAASAGPSAGSEDRRQFPWGDETPGPEQANLDWRNSGLIDVHALPAGDSAFGCRQMIGNVWEWTADEFQPYPGFTTDPYKEYSKPWFGTHKVLRGGCWSTRSLLIRNTWRNFYTPDRNDVWAGFRTCAR